MLSSIRKFSSSIFAKIFLVIIAIPFIFWGMGDVFRGGNVNTIVKINNENISTKEFVNFVENNLARSNEKKINKNLIDRLLYQFIGEKIVALEIEKLNINIPNKALSKIIKNQKFFKKDDEFSRTEYEKFLLQNSIDAITFEKNFSNQERKNQFFKFVSGGIVPPYFLVNMTFNEMNQKRKVDFINLNDLMKNQTKFTENEINQYYNKNRDSFTEIYKTIEFINLTPKNLSDAEEYNDLFFEKIDEIDDLIVQNVQLNSIVKKFDLDNLKSITINEIGENVNSKKIKVIDDDFIKKVFNFENENTAELIEHGNKFFIFQISKIDSIEKKVTEESVRKKIILELKKKDKRKMLGEIVNKINNKNFKKSDFYKFSKEKELIIKKIEINGKNDDKIFKKELLGQIYRYNKDEVIVVADIGLIEIYLIYISEVKNKTVDKNSDEYNEYLNLSRSSIATNVFNTYDTYLNKKYEIDINYKALNGVSSYF